MTISKTDWQKIESTFSRYAKIIGEDFTYKFGSLAEMQEEQGKKIDLLFEMVAQNTEDIAIIKSDISFIKKELKHKVDLDEFEALEKRVLFLEKKLKRA